MKRPLTVLSAGLLSLLPFSLAHGQEKKNEEKVKIIISDKEGTKTIIDTTFTGDNKIDSIRLKNGSILYLRKHRPGNEKDLSAIVDKNGDNYIVYAGSGDENSERGKRYRIITRVEKDGDKTGSRYIYVNSDNDQNDLNNEFFDTGVDNNEFDHDTDKTRHVIAKDGIVVTIEGKDEAKVQEVAKEIEKTLDISGDKSANSESGKTTVKKK
ncbi:MAG: hypothetical protein Q8868_02440 [Bacteroidota bacterium]|nr:hypothetical protein [Bacteroidota bacterium]